MAATALSKQPSQSAPPALTGTRKAAVLLIALGTEAAARILKCLRDEEVERLSIEIARFQNVSSELVEAVLTEYRRRSAAQSQTAQGGAAFAREALASALGPHRAEDVMMKVEVATDASAHLLQHVETEQLVNFLGHEHPQTTALVLAHLNPRKAAAVLAGLASELQSEVVYRLATMGKTSPELLRDVEAVIREQIGSVFGSERTPSGGVEKVADILKNTRQADERSILDAIQSRDAGLALSIRNLMFVFEDLLHLTDRNLQRVLMEIEDRELVLSLKAASEELKEKLLANVSERAAQQIREELDLLGPVRVSEVNEAQRSILATAQGILEEEGVLSQDTDELIL